MTITDQTGTPELAAIRETIAFLHSVILSGERYTPRVLQAHNEGLEALASLRGRYEQRERRAEETALAFGEIEHLIEHEYRLKHHSLDLVLNTILDVARSARAVLVEAETAGEKPLLVGKHPRPDGPEEAMHP